MNALGKSLYRNLLSHCPDRLAVSLDFFLSHRTLPHLRHPRTFSEKIQHRKLYNRDPRFPVLADKNLVKGYVADAVGPEWLIPTLWSGKALPPRESRNWPIPYVLKAAHSSGQNLFVTTPEAQNWDVIEPRVNSWLKRSHASAYREWLYAQIPPSLLVEPYVGREGVLPLDYKFYVFGGVVRYIQVDTGRAHNHRRCFFDRSWNRQPFGLMYPLETDPVSRPESLEAMVSAAERLGRDFAFVRVDLYEISRKPLFGEMTFYPGSGREGFFPQDYDRLFGELWPEVYCYVRSDHLSAVPAAAQV